MTANDWLALGDDLGLELAKVLTPGPWEHNTQIQPTGQVQCIKCCLFAYYWQGKYVMEDKSDACTVPDPIDTEDWNLLIDYIRETFVSDRQRSDFLIELVDMCDAAPVDYLGTNDDSDFMLWLLFITQPRKLWIAAAMAQGAK